MNKKMKLLPADPDISKLQERRERLNDIVDELRLSINKLPEGSLHIVKSSRGVQYYHRADPKDKSGNYIRKSNQANKRAEGTGCAYCNVRCGLCKDLAGGGLHR